MFFFDSPSLSRAEEDGIPVCSPIKTLEDLLQWECGQDDLCISREALQPRAPCSHRPLTLVCHDMRGSYLEDRFIQSVNKENGYRFFNWQYIDLFVYFSHYFVTIPPCGWIISAHRNRVPILGTIITEHEEGRRICSQLLSCPEKFKAVADKMVDIAVYYNMDGWLLNIENEIEKNQIANLCNFIEDLKSKMSQRIPHSKIIWYDSVTKNGQLLWQNELNEENMLFFEKCDGIFLNYTWSLQSLKKSKNKSMKKNRPFDVFVGVDVFGRGCFKGGGYNCNQALEVIRKEELSAAIFANGWVYECLGEKQFLENETKFWSLLHKYCSLNCPTELPFVTSFCHGYGQKYFLNGQCLSDREWVSLGLQQLQPVKKDEDVTCEMFLDEAFLGGGCLLVGNENNKNKDHQCSLFSCWIPIEEPLLVSYTVKYFNEDFPIRLEMTLIKDNDDVSVVSFPNDKESCNECSVPQINGKNLEELLADFKDVLFVPLNEERRGRHQGWKQYFFVLNSKWLPSKITDISIGTDRKSGKEESAFLFGQLQILPVSFFEKNKKPEIFNLSFKEHEESANVALEWRISDHSSVNHFNVYVTDSNSVSSSGQLLGHTTGCKYVIRNSILKQFTKPIQVTIQPVLRIGFVVPIEQCKSISLSNRGLASL